MAYTIHASLIVIAAAAGLLAAPDLVVSPCDDASDWSSGTTATDTLQEGAGSLRWDHGSASSVRLDSFPTDFSRHLALSFWMHSSVDNNQNFMLIIGSENDSSSGMDYFSMELTADFVGWQHVELERSSFNTNRSPLGWDSITSFYFTADGWGNTPNPANVIHLDDIRLTGDPPQPRDVLANLRAGHPRLLIPDGDWAAVKTRMEQHQYTQDAFTRVQDRADDYLTAPVETYEIPDGLRLLATSREVLKRVYHLAFAYRMTDDTRYVDRAYQELEAAAAFPDWNPQHFLDVGEMTHAFAIGYDWLYDALTPQQLEVVRQAIITHGLNAYLTGHAENAWWLFSEFNWNTVTNGGVGMGALALAGTDSALAHDIVNKTLMSMEGAGSIEMFGPDGAWAESPGYWTYATRYLCTYTAALESALGNTFGILDVPGVSATGGFPVYMSGPTWRLFNYADGSDSRIRAPWLYWLAEKFDRPLYSWFQTEAPWPEVMDIVWYQPLTSSPSELDLPLDAYYRKVEVATFRSAWEDSSALFVGFKAGDNDVGHSHLDLGEFILDALGVRWVHDEAHEDYNIGDYFSASGWDAPRWSYYRTRAEANNCLVINPDSLADQDPEAVTDIVKYSAANDGEALAVADLTDAYENMGATRVWRGVAMINNRTQILLQDEVTLSSPGEVWWFMNTEADATIASDSMSAVLTLDGERLSVRVLTPGTGRLQVVAGEPLPTSPNPSGQAANSHKLAMHLQNVTSMTLPVLFTPLPGTQDPADDSIPSVLALSDSTWPSGLEMHTGPWADATAPHRTPGARQGVYRLGRDPVVTFVVGGSAGTLVVTDLGGNVVYRVTADDRDESIVWPLNDTRTCPGTYVYRFSSREHAAGGWVGRAVILH